MSNPETWKVLALSLAEAIKCVISNAHYDLRHGIGDVEHMLSAIQMQRKIDQQRSNPTHPLLLRIQDYLGNGGLINPEMMEHDKVRNLIIDCREYIEKTQ